MTREHWRRLEAMFQSVLELPASRRPAFLQEMCPTDPLLRRELESLLISYEQMADFLVEPRLVEENLTAEPLGAFTTEAVVLKDRYRIEKRLGRGGFAATYLASDLLLHSRKVVIKVLFAHRAADPWALRKFIQEMEVLARIDDPGVVGILDSGELADHTPFLVMQFVNGVRLRDLMTSSGMDLTRIGKIVLQIGRALGAAHDAGVCHRDLKPENIMVQARGEEELVKLIDFGVASIRDSAVDSAESGIHVVGTLSYMAPEQFTGSSSAASDIYSLAVITYELLTGRRPFEGVPPTQAPLLRREGIVRRLAELRPGLPPAAEAAVLKALSYDPEDRPRSAVEFGESFAGALIATEPQQVTHGERAYDTGRQLRTVAEDYYEQGLARQAMEQYRPAIEDFTEAIRLKPDCVKAYLSRALALQSIGLYEDAIDDYNAVVHLREDSAEVYNRRGGAYYSLGQYTRAIEDYDQAIRLKPDFAEAYYNRSLAFQSAGNCKRAAEDQDQAVRLRRQEGAAAPDAETET